MFKKDNAKLYHSLIYLITLFILVSFIYCSNNSGSKETENKYKPKNPNMQLLKEIQKGGYILLMRHGEKEKEHLISYKDKLSDEGIEKAKVLGLWIKNNNVPISHIYRTHSLRTQETSKYVYGCDISPKWQSECKEAKEETKLFPCYPDERANCSTLDFAEIELGKLHDLKKESIEEVNAKQENHLSWIEKAYKFLYNIPKEYYTNTNVAVVAHRNINFGIVTLIGDNDVQKRIHLSTLSIIVVKPENGKLIVKGLLIEGVE